MPALAVGRRMILLIDVFMNERDWISFKVWLDPAFFLYCLGAPSERSYLSDQGHCRRRACFSILATMTKHEAVI